MADSAKKSDLAMSVRTTRLAETLLASSSIFSVAAYGYIGFFTRSMGDDFHHWNVAHAHGLIGAQSYWYQNWTGRYSFIFFSNVLALCGPRIVRFLPALFLVLWYAATVLAVRQLQWLNKVKPRYGRAALYAGVIILATLATAPNVPQSLYWQTGAVNYITPLIAFSFFVAAAAWTLRSATSPGAHLSLWRLSICALLAFVSCGFTESFGAVQVAGLFGAVLICRRYAAAEFKSPLTVILMAALVSSLVGLAVVLAAPGNALRQSHFPQPPGAFQILGQSAFYSLAYSAKTILEHPLVFALLLLLPFFITISEGRDSFGEHRRSRARLLLLLIPVTVFALEICIIAPAFFGMSTMLPERGRILLSFMLVCGTLVWAREAAQFFIDGWFGLVQKRKRIAQAGAFVLLGVMIACQVTLGVSTLALNHRAKAYAADWDKQDAELRAARESGVRAVTVKQIGDFQWRLGLGYSELHLRPKPKFSYNKAMATYYGLDSLAASEDVDGPP